LSTLQRLERRSVRTEHTTARLLRRVADTLVAKADERLDQ
jgi:hypothetical protein